MVFQGFEIIGNQQIDQVMIFNQESSVYDKDINNQFFSIFCSKYLNNIAIV